MREKKKKEINNETNQNLNMAWEYHKASDTLLSGRVNFFIVAESMLLLSYVTAFNLIGRYRDILVTIAIVGIVITSLWYYINTRLAVRLRTLKNDYLKKDPVYQAYVKSVDVLPVKIPATKILTIYLPNTLTTLWVFLLFYSINPWENIIITFLFLPVAFFIVFKIFDKIIGFNNLKDDSS